jgi:hypothetical protein
MEQGKIFEDNKKLMITKNDLTNFKKLFHECKIRNLFNPVGTVS